MVDYFRCSNSHLMMCKKDECTKRLAQKSLHMFIFRFSFRKIIRMISATLELRREHTVQDKASDIGSKFPG